MNSPFPVSDGSLCVEGVACEAIAERFGTPVFAYSRRALEGAFRSLAAALARRDHLICYAVKANSNLAILRLFARLGSGFDIVSGGELARVIAAGGEPSKVVFSGVGKSEQEIRLGIEHGVLCFNVESEAELARVAEVARSTGKDAPVSFRVNPDVDPRTHPYISTGLRNNKFGIPFDDALRLYREAAAMPGIRVTGIDCHIGSQMLDLAPVREAVERMVGLVERLEREGIHLWHIDAGGGLGIRYRDEVAPEVEDYAAAIDAALGGRKEQLLLEPGRWLVGNAGVLLTRVQYLKHGEARNFAVVDAAMNDLLRPALYDAYHEIRETRVEGAARIYDVVGPVCESGDFLGQSRLLHVAPGSLLAVMSAGAYAASMGSNYNTRPRSAEVLVDGGAVHLIAERESLESLFSRERIAPCLLD